MNKVPQVTFAFWVIKISATTFTEILFWMAFILTRPLGATLGDLLTKPRVNGGLNLGRITSSLIIGVLMVGSIMLASKESEQRST